MRGDRLLGAMLAMTAVIAGCTPDRGSEAPDTSAVQPANEADRNRLATIQEIRKVDICALYGGASEVAGRKLIVDGQRSMIGCEARIGDARSGITATIYLVVGPAVPPADDSWVRHVDVDGADVRVADFWDAPNPPPRDQMVSTTCDVSVSHPGGVRLSVVVTNPPAVDGCPIGLDLLRVAMPEFAKRPPWGTSSTPRTALSGADPCRAVTRLRTAHTIVWDVPASNTRTCGFTIDGSPPVEVEFDYAEPRLTQYNPDRFDVGGQQVSGSAASGIFEVVVGPEFQVGAKTLVPAVTIIDLSKDMERIRVIAQAVADEY